MMVERYMDDENRTGGPDDIDINVNANPPLVPTPEPGEIHAEDPAANMDENPPLAAAPEFGPEHEDDPNVHAEGTHTGDDDEKRPAGMSTNIELLPTAHHRRHHVDLQLEQKERNFRSEMHEISDLIEVIQENILFDKNLSDKEKSEEINRYLNEIQAREWIHGLHRNIFSGKFEEAQDSFGGFGAYLPILLDHIPGLRTALRAYEGINPETGENNNFSIFTQPNAVKSRFEDQLRTDIKKEHISSHPEDPAEANVERITYVSLAAQRIAERLLVTMGIASQVGTVVIRTDRKPEEFSDSLEEWQRLGWEKRMDFVKNLDDWQEQINLKKVVENGLPQFPEGMVDINASFRTSLPNDLGELMYLGYRMEWDARADNPTDTTLPKPPAEMKSHVMLPGGVVDNLLQTGGRRALIWTRTGWEMEENKDTGEKVDAELKYENDKKEVVTIKKKFISRVEEFAGRLSAQGSQVNLDDNPSLISWIPSTPDHIKNMSPADLLKIPWSVKAKYIDDARTDNNIQKVTIPKSNTGAPLFLWPGRLNAAKKISGEYKGMAANPSVQQVLKTLESAAAFGRGDKEELAKLILGKGFEFLTKYKEKYFQGSNISKEAASNMFSAANQMGVLSLRGVSDLYLEKVTPGYLKWLGPKAYYFLAIKAYFKLVDAGGAISKMFGEFFKKVAGGR
jgi:hypothetical protein